MSDLNCISFTGRLGKDAELKFAQSGTPIWSANVGVGYGYGDKRGTNWLKVQVFGKRAESLGKLDLTKGTQVAVTGELRLREYEHNGSKGWSHEVIASDVHLLGSPKVSDQPTRQSQPRQQPAPMDDFADDDLPPF